MKQREARENRTASAVPHLQEAEDGVEVSREGGGLGVERVDDARDVAERRLQGLRRRAAEGART